MTVTDSHLPWYLPLHHRRDRWVHSSHFGNTGENFYAKLLLLDKIRHLPVLWGRTRLQREP